MARKLRINGHSHLLPYPEQIPQFMKDKKIFWVDDDRQFMLQNNWKRPISHPSFFLYEKVDWMEEYKIDHEVILNLSQLYGNGMPKDIFKDVHRFQNNFNAEIEKMRDFMSNSDKLIRNNQKTITDAQRNSE